MGQGPEIGSDGERKCDFMEQRGHPAGELRSFVNAHDHGCGFKNLSGIVSVSDRGWGTVCRVQCVDRTPPIVLKPQPSRARCRRFNHPKMTCCGPDQVVLLPAAFRFGFLVSYRNKKSGPTRLCLSGFLLPSFVQTVIDNVIVGTP